VFLDCEYDVRRAIAYTVKNPEKDGLKRQTWSFVTPYDDWVLVEKHIDLDRELSPGGWR
jgi:hypothetical protein